MANTIQIDIINESSLDDATVSAAVPALQKQLEEHFKPVWGFGADLHFVPKGGKPASGHWWCGVFDNSDQPGALGYHDLTNEGLPFTKVFQATDAQYGEKWTVTLSHELVEMLGDPDINLVVFVQKSNTVGTLFAYETADPVQGDEYEIDGVWVSNFVLPTYFEAQAHPAGTKFDHMGLLHQPLPALRPGGYYSYYQVGSGKGWKQKMAQTVASRKHDAHIGSRRHLRGVDLDERRHSVKS